ncbi:MAG: hypothetical protein R3D00_23895 [Bacteroidia bacterium]
MDKLEFVIDTIDVGTYLFRQAKILINNTELTEIVQDYELILFSHIERERITESYSYRSSKDLLKMLEYSDYASRDRRKYLSENYIEESYDSNIMIILQCQCRHLYCSPLYMRVKLEGEKVLWTDFSIKYPCEDVKPLWDYSALGQFEFDKSDYVQQLAKLRMGIGRERLKTKIKNKKNKNQNRGKNKWRFW